MVIKRMTRRGQQEGKHYSHPLLIHQGITVISINPPLPNVSMNGTAGRTSNTQYTRLFDQQSASAGGEEKRRETSKETQKETLKETGRREERNGLYHEGLNWASSSSYHRKYSTCPASSCLTELQTTGKEAHQIYLRQPVIHGRTRQSHAVRTLTPGFVGLEQRQQMRNQ